MKFVKYEAKFPFESRSISAEEWRRQGVDQGDLLWDQTNNWLVPLSDISEGAMPYILADTGLSIVSLDEEPIEPDD